MPAAKATKPQPSPRKPTPAPPSVLPSAAPAPLAASAVTAPANSKSHVSPPPATRKIASGPVTPFWKVLLALLVIAGAGLLTYSNSFHGEFALDDLPAITDNRSIQFTDQNSVVKGWIAALHPPTDGQTVTNRPLVNLSFAANFRWNSTQGRGNGLGVVGYHVTNFVIHLLAALALFGLVRRTLELPKLRARWAGESVPLALAATLLWMLHPLQTESVAYVAQRAESLMGLFFLAAFYCFVRGTQRLPWLWLTLSVLACLLGVFCKEVMITAPALILLFDVIFVAEKPLDSLRRRWPAYGAMLVVMAVLAWRAFNAGTRGNSAGFGAGLTWYDYAMAQYPSILNYLKLSFWPHPLVLYYGESVDQIEKNYGLTADAVGAMLAIMALGALTVWLLWERPRLGFLGAWFFVILAPSSSFVPITTEIAAEHRMYLPLAALAVLAALGLHAWLGRRALGAALAAAAALGLATHARNLVYHSGLALWQDAAAQRPDIARSRENFGIMLANSGRYLEAIQEYRTALKLRDFYPDCENNLGNALAQLSQNAEAAQHYLIAIRGLSRPVDRAQAFYNLGNAERGLALAAPNPMQDPHMQQALNHYLTAVQLDPFYAAAYHNIGSLLSDAGRYDEAIKYYLLALQAKPIFPEAELNLGNTYAQSGHPAEAMQRYQRAIQENPADPIGHLRVAGLLYDAGNLSEAVKEFTLTAKLAPTAPEAHFYLARCLARLGQRDDAVREYQNALRLKPDFSEAAAALSALQAGAQRAP